MILLIKGTRGEALSALAQRLGGTTARIGNMREDGYGSTRAEVIGDDIDASVRDWFNNDPITADGRHFAPGTLLFFSDPVEG